jgi:hypothetical protein
MGWKNACNMGTPAKKSGTAAKRIDPNSFARNNLAKGGVNDKKFLIKSGKTSAGKAK